MKRKVQGRPTKFSPEVVKAICDGVLNWHPLRYAAIRAGVGHSTLHAWLSDPSPRFQEFRDQLERARADRVAELAATVAKSVKGPKGDPDRALKMLERLEPRDFGQQVRVHVEEEFEAAIARLEVEFANEPQILDRALAAIAGSESAGTSRRAKGSGEGE